MRQWNTVTFWWAMFMLSMIAVVLVLSLYGVLRVSAAR